MPEINTLLQEYLVETNKQAHYIAVGRYLRSEGTAGETKSRYELLMPYEAIYYGMSDVYSTSL